MPNGDWEEQCETVFCQELRKGATIKANKLRPGRVRYSFANDILLENITTEAISTNITLYFKEATKHKSF